MNFKQLEYFVAVAEAKSISKAARKLHVAQPPISRQIAMLEDELKVCLFLRTNKGVELTEAGRSLYQQSQHMFHYHTGCEQYCADDDWEQIAFVLYPETIADFS